VLILWPLVAAIFHFILEQKTIHRHWLHR
jgi:hypothetical protein